MLILQGPLLPSAALLLLLLLCCCSGVAMLLLYCCAPLSYCCAAAVLLLLYCCFAPVLMLCYSAVPVLGCSSLRCAVHCSPVLTATAIALGVCRRLHHVAVGERHDATEHRGQHLQVVVAPVGLPAQGSGDGHVALQDGVRVLHQPPFFFSTE